MSHIKRIACASESSRVVTVHCVQESSGLYGPWRRAFSHTKKTLFRSSIRLREIHVGNRKVPESWLAATLLSCAELWAIGFSRCRLADWPTDFQEQVAKPVTKLASRLEVQIKPQWFESMDPILIAQFLQAFKMACDNYRVNKGAAMWLGPFLQKNTAANGLTAPSLWHPDSGMIAWKNVGSTLT